eukprot:scaffold2694_cov336-Prasinococcus_capsulatus_cf.AAC.2
MPIFRAIAQVREVGHRMASVSSSAGRAIRKGWSRQYGPQRQTSWRLPGPSPLLRPNGASRIYYLRLSRNPVRLSTGRGSSWRLGTNSLSLAWTTLGG